MKSASETSMAIVDQALEIALEQGAGALTGRLAAARASTSASSVNYHLGGRGRLLRAVHERLDEDRAAWRRERLATLAAAPIAPAAPASLVVALVAEQAGARRRQTLLSAELVDLAGRGGEAPDILAAERVAEEAFWPAALAGFGLAPEAAALWGVFAAGASSFAVLDGDAVRRQAWLSDLGRRLADRLAGWRPPAGTAPEPMGPAPAEPAEQPEGRQRLIAAAMQLIGTHGLDHLTQRRVAAASGLSLASTTYHFASKEALVMAAFTELYRQAMASYAAPSAGLTDVAADLVTAEGAVRWQVGAMEELHIAAARDPVLAGFAGDLLRLRGRGSARWLAGRGSPADRADGLVWSVIIGGLFRRALLRPPADRRAWLSATATLFHRMLFEDPSL